MRLWTISWTALEVGRTGSWVGRTMQLRFGPVQASGRTSWTIGSVGSTHGRRTLIFLRITPHNSLTLHRSRPPRTRQRPRLLTTRTAITTVIDAVRGELEQLIRRQHARITTFVDLNERNRRGAPAVIDMLARAPPSYARYWYWNTSSAS